MATDRFDGRGDCSTCTRGDNSEEYIKDLEEELATWARVAAVLDGHSQLCEVCPERGTQLCPIDGPCVPLAYAIAEAYGENWREKLEERDG